MDRRGAQRKNSAVVETRKLGSTISLPALLDRGTKADDTFRQLLYNISVMASHLETARQYLAERLGVTSPQYNIVMVVAQSKSPHGISVSDVAARLNVSGAFVTTEVKKLVKAQLLVKASNPEDGRGVLLRLSDSGFEKVRALEPDLLMVNDRLFEQLSRDDFQHLSRTVMALITAFEPTVSVLRVMTDNEAQSKKVAQKSKLSR